MIGGGARASYFNQMIADRTGKEVLTGSTEATAVGNIVVQLVAMGRLKRGWKKLTMLLRSSYN